MTQPSHVRRRRSRQQKRMRQAANQGSTGESSLPLPLLRLPDKRGTSTLTLGTMKFVTVCLFITLLAPGVFAAEDPSIDRLIAKLPPPEKFIDPAANDPLVNQMLSALRQRNF